MHKVLLTGASGGIGTRLRTLLKPIYPELVLSDLKAPEDLRADEKFIAADLSDIGEVERRVDGIDGIVHLGGYSVEGPWETILQSNIIGTYNLFEAARRQGREAGRVRLVRTMPSASIRAIRRSAPTSCRYPTRATGVSKAVRRGVGRALRL